jgi:hypothetical protein
MKEKIRRGSREGMDNRRETIGKDVKTRRK